MRLLFKLLFITIILVSCKNKGFFINGHIEGLEDKALIMLYDSDGNKIDSTFSTKDKFTFTGKVDIPTQCYLKYKNESINIWVENVDITIKSKFPEMERNSIIKGGKEQELSNLVTKVTLPYMRKIEDISSGKISNSTDAQKELNIALKKLYQTLSNFGKKHYNSYVGLEILYNVRNHIAKDSLLNIYNQLSPDLKQSKNAKALQTFLYNNTVKTGNPFIDFNAKTIDGKNFKLSSLKGKYIYLSFWSADCSPCRKENRFFSENFNKLPKDLSIVGFSIDKDISKWMKASKDDNILWINVSDNEGEKGKVKTLYNAQALPTSYFIDKEGIVVKKFTGFGDGNMLIDELNTLIKENK